MNTQQSPYVDEDGTADFLGLPPRTLERYRTTGVGPAYRKHGRRVYWSESRRRWSTADGGDDATDPGHGGDAA